MTAAISSGIATTYLNTSPSPNSCAGRTYRRIDTLCRAENMDAQRSGIFAKVQKIAVDFFKWLFSFPRFICNCLFSKPQNNASAVPIVVNPAPNRRAVPRPDPQPPQNNRPQVPIVEGNEDPRELLNIVRERMVVMRARMAEFRLNRDVDRGMALQDELTQLKQDAANTNNQAVSQETNQQADAYIVEICELYFESLRTEYDRLRNTPRDTPDYGAQLENLRVRFLDFSLVFMLRDQVLGARRDYWVRERVLTQNANACFLQMQQAQRSGQQLERLPDLANPSLIDPQLINPIDRVREGMVIMRARMAEFRLHIDINRAMALQDGLTQLKQDAANTNNQAVSQETNQQANAYIGEICELYFESLRTEYDRLRNTPRDTPDYEAQLENLRTRLRNFSFDFMTRGSVLQAPRGRRGVLVQNASACRIEVGRALRSGQQLEPLPDLAVGNPPLNPQLVDPVPNQVPAPAPQPQNNPPPQVLVGGGNEDPRELLNIVRGGMVVMRARMAEFRLNRDVDRGMALQDELTQLKQDAANVNNEIVSQETNQQADAYILEICELYFESLRTEYDRLRNTPRNAPGYEDQLENLRTKLLDFSLGFMFRFQVVLAMRNYQDRLPVLLQNANTCYAQAMRTRLLGGQLEPLPDLAAGNPPLINPQPVNPAPNPVPIPPADALVGQVLEEMEAMRGQRQMADFRGHVNRERGMELQQQFHRVKQEAQHTNVLVISQEATRLANTFIMEICDLYAETLVAEAQPFLRGPLNNLILEGARDLRTRLFDFNAHFMRQEAVVRTGEFGHSQRLMRAVGRCSQNLSNRIRILEQGAAPVQPVAAAAPAAELQAKEIEVQNCQYDYPPRMNDRAVFCTPTALHAVKFIKEDYAAVIRAVINEDRFYLNGMTRTILEGGARLFERVLQENDMYQAGIDPEELKNLFNDDPLFAEVNFPAHKQSFCGQDPGPYMEACKASFTEDNPPFDADQVHNAAPFLDRLFVDPVDDTRPYAIVSVDGKTTACVGINAELAFLFDSHVRRVKVVGRGEYEQFLREQGYGYQLIECHVSTIRVG